MKHLGYLLALSAAGLFPACSLGPPDLSPVLADSPEGNRAFHVYEFGGQGTRSYESEEEPLDPDSPSVQFGATMNYLEVAGRYSLLIRRGGFLAAPYLSHLGMVPGLGAGYAFSRVYAAGFISALWWDLASPGLSAQAGVKLGESWSLRVDNYSVRYVSSLGLEDRRLHWEPSRMTRVSLTLRVRHGTMGGVALSPHAIWNHTRGFPGGGVVVTVHLPSAFGSGGGP